MSKKELLEKKKQYEHDLIFWKEYYAKFPELSQTALREIKRVTEALEKIIMEIH